VRLLLAVLILLILGLLAQGILDSAVGAWIAFGSLIAIVAMKLLGWIGLWPADWPDIFGAGD
jgi:hypothetical protein